MRTWILYSLAATVLWGLWGIIFAMGDAAMKGNATSSLLMQALCVIGLVPVVATALFSQNLKRGKNLRRGCAWAFVTGLCGALANVTSFEALRLGGDVTTVVPLVAMYPLVTVVLARVFLRERLSALQIAAIFVALLSIYLFNMGAPGSAATAATKSPLSLPLVLALVSLVAMGIAGITQKLATEQISTELSTICFSAAFALSAAVILLGWRLEWNISGAAWGLSIVNGAVIGVAMLASFAAYRLGKAAVVTALQALYPVVTVLVAIPLLGDRMTWPKGVAIVLALAAGLALSHEAPPEAAPSNTGNPVAA